MAISFLATLLRVIIEGGTFQAVPTGQDPKTSPEAEESSGESTLGSEFFGGVYRAPPPDGQDSNPIPLNPYKEVFATLLLAMLAQPYRPSDFEPIQSVVNGVKEYAILLNALQRALGSTRNLRTDTRDSIYWLCGAMPAHKSTLR